MRGSITFKFGGGVDKYCVRSFGDGELDSVDLEVIAALIEEEIKLKRLIASGEIKPTPADPTGIDQFQVHWSN